MSKKKESFISKHTVLFGILMGIIAAAFLYGILLSPFIFLLVSDSVSTERGEAELPYLQTLKRQSDAAVYESGCGRAVFYSDGNIDMEAIEEEYALDFTDVVAVSENYVFFKTCAAPCDVYRLNRGLTELQKIVTVPDYTECSVYGYTLCYTEDDGKRYICDLFTDEVTYVGDDDSYFYEHFTSGRRYTLEEGYSVLSGGYYMFTDTVANEVAAKITRDSFAAVPEIYGSVLEDDLSVLDYCYYGGDIYFCVGMMENVMVWDAVLIFKYSPETDTMTYYSWMDTSDGFDSPCSLYVFASSESD